MTENSDYIVGLDAGSDKIFCAVGRVVRLLPNARDPETGLPRGLGEDHRAIEIVGTGTARSEGIVRGNVHDMDKAVGCVRKAIDEASKNAGGFRIERVIAAIGGSDLVSVNCTGSSVVKNNEVQDDDVKLADKNAQSRAENVQAEKGHLIKVVHCGWTCGDTTTLNRPVGLVGERVVANMHAVYSSRLNAANMRRCLARTGVTLEQYIPHTWASGIAVLTTTEKEYGSVVFDIGAQTTSVSVFNEGVICYSYVQPFGADYFTRDVALVFGLGTEDAESLKQTSGHCLPSKVDPNETVAGLPSTRGMHNRISRHLLARTLHERALEFFRLYRNRLARDGVLGKVHNVVLTGGGSKLRGLQEVAHEVFDLPVRTGKPIHVTPDIPRDPANSVCLGLLLSRFYDPSLSEPKEKGKSKLNGFQSSLASMFCGNFR